MRAGGPGSSVCAARRLAKCAAGSAIIRSSRRRSKRFANSTMNCCVQTRRRRGAGGRAMIEMRRAQRSFGDGLIAAEVSDLREPWMTHADAVLADEQLVATVYEALAKRHPKSRSRGRKAAPAEMVLRLLILKHVRNWSYEALEREVHANLVYRDFARVGGAKMPDAKTMGRWGVALGPQVIAQIHERMVTIAEDKGVAKGRNMRLDTTEVETNIHYPTDSSLLGDGVRVLTRIMKKITAIAGAAGTKLRDRSRSVKLRGLDIARAARSTATPGRAKLNRAYGQLLSSTSRVVGQAKRFAAEIAGGVKGATDVRKQLALEGLGAEIERMVPLFRKVRKQTRARIFRGDTRSEGKIVSVFEPSTEIIRKGKTSKPTEFGKMVKLQEAESQIVTAYEVYDRRPSDCDLLVGAIDIHQARLGRIPRLVAADAAFYSANNEAAAKPKASSASAFPIAPPKAPRANANRRSAGSATARNGAPDARDASAWPDADA